MHTFKELEKIQEMARLLNVKLRGQS
jgi:hypothetical protein